MTRNLRSVNRNHVVLFGGGSSSTKPQSYPAMHHSTKQTSVLVEIDLNRNHTSFFRHQCFNAKKKKKNCFLWLQTMRRNKDSLPWNEQKRLCVRLSSGQNCTAFCQSQRISGPCSNFPSPQDRQIACKPKNQLIWA